MEENLTPMMRQYREAKAAIPADAVLLFRLGDFYEEFFEDAERVSSVLELTLTKRQGVPMCGFPYHALENYLPRLVAAGVKVAIAEQMEDPKLAQGIVKRQVTRIITPGTIIDNALLNPACNNYLTALVAGRDRSALASLDISTGEFRVTEITSPEKLRTELDRLNTRECVISHKLAAEFRANDSRPETRNEILWTELDSEEFEFERSETFLKEHFQVATLDGFGCRDLPLSVIAAGAVLRYATENLRQEAGHINRLELYSLDHSLELDSISQRNLELVETMFGSGKNGSLLGVLDHTVTPMGGRRLRGWVLRPLCDHDAIVARLDAVEQFTLDPLTLTELRETIGVVRDLERIIGRLNVGSAGPRDLQTLSASLGVLPGVRALLGAFAAPLLEQLNARLELFPELTERIDAAIADEAPALLADGGVIRPGYSQQLDELRAAATDGKGWLSQIQQREQERTGIKSLKVKFNSVFGYYIEVSNSFKELVPETYIRKQTLVNGERYITEELKNLEQEILTAGDRDKALEFELFSALRDAVTAESVRIQRAAGLIAELDTLCSLASVAVNNNYCRPSVDDSGVIEIHDGRHPVVERVLKDALFVPNDTYMGEREDRAAIITGPNMAGKSTYMRQVALITLMAQIGSFVPAKSARIGVVDRIFTRIGASDDLAGGQSTFMVEMTEVSEILHQATPRSLLILDEIGRGTSTFDGMSIARAVLEFCADPKRLGAKTLFATHYHELTELEGILPGVKNYSISIKKRGDELIFLRKIVPGGADRSYGIEVAKLAGLPNEVVKRANVILKELEQGGAYQAKPREETEQVSLDAIGEAEVLAAIRRAQPDTMSPIEAMQLLYELKQKLS